MTTAKGDRERDQRDNLWVHTAIFQSTLDSGAPPHASVPDCKTASLHPFGNVSTLFFVQIAQ